MAEGGHTRFEGFNTRLSRRTVLRGGLIGGAGLAAAALIGCDGGEEGPPTATPAPTQIARPRRQRREARRQRRRSAAAAPATPTAAPTQAPTATPTAAPTQAPTAAPTQAPTATPAARATAVTEVTGEYPRRTQAEIEQAVADMNRQAELDGAPYPYDYVDPPGDPVEGGILKIGVTFSIGNWDISTWDISTSQAGATTTIPTAAYNRLLGLDHGPGASKFQVVLEPELATTWENTPDGLEYTFNLGEGVKWQNVVPLNGRDFTSEDVLWAYTRQSTTNINTGPFNLVTGMTTPDANTFGMSIERPSPDFLIPFSQRWMGIYPRELEYDLHTTAIGTGPLIITEVEEGSHVNMVTNPDYWEKNRYGRGPFLDGLEWRVMSDQTARVAALRTGQIDYAYGYPSTLAHALDLLETNPDFTVLADPILTNSSAWGFNQTLLKFADKRVRAGIQMGVNRALNVQRLYDGIGTYLPTAAWPFVFDHTPTFEAGELGPYWEYNPDDAKKLLAAAGQENLQFNLLTTDFNNRLGENDLIQEQLRAIGITVDFVRTDPLGFNAQWVPGEYEEAADGWATSSPSADGSYYDQIHSQSYGNRWYIDNPEIDAWAEAQQVELDPEARRELHTKIWYKLLDEVYRLESVHSFPLTAYPPHMRFARFNGPYISYHYFYRFGDTFMDMWLAK